VARDRDIGAFDARALGYETGWLGRFHHQIADRTADLALALVPAPQRILDVGCGTGYLLRQLAARCPQASELAGIDPAPAMIEAARAAATDDRLRFTSGIAERLPCPAAGYDLVVTTTSFDHWASQQGRAGGVRSGAGTLRLAGAHRPILRLARAHPDGQPPR
jgi:SAM-dependent methyltransferase